jgi:hypothetical protein
MKKIYMPAEKVLVVCACGCGRTRWGNKKARYYNQNCRVRAFLRRKEQQSATTEISLE